MKRPLKQYRPLGPFVEQTRGRSDTIEEVEERLYGMDTGSECQVILEVYGVTPEIRRTVIDKAEDTFDDIRISEGLPMEIYFTRKRANYKKIKEFVFFTEKILANSMQENQVSIAVVSRAIRNNDVDELVDNIDNVATFQAKKQLDAYLKPNEDVLATQTMRPRPSIVFELMYDVPRRAELSDVEDSLQELIDEGAMGNIGQLEIMEQKDSMIAIPLNTAVDIDDFSVTDFNMYGIAQDIASDIDDGEIREFPKLERMTATCTKVG
jgi:hypothetical protein